MAKPTIGFEIDDEDVVRLVGKDLPEKAHGELAKAFRSIAIQFERDFIKARLSRRFAGGRSRAGRRFLYRRTGSLARSFTRRFTKGATLSKLSVRFGWMDSRSAMIAGVHEFGARIRPRRRRALTVPLSEAMTRAGVARRPGARSYPNAFIFRKGTEAFIAEKRGKRSKKIRLLYKLVRAVKIPPRLAFRDTFAKWSVSKGNRILSDALARVTA